MQPAPVPLVSCGSLLLRLLMFSCTNLVRTPLGPVSYVCPPSLPVSPAFCLARPCLVEATRPGPHRHCGTRLGWVSFTRPPWRLLRAIAGWGQPLAGRLLRFRDLPRRASSRTCGRPRAPSGASSPTVARLWGQRPRLHGLGSVRLWAVLTLDSYPGLYRSRRPVLRA